MIQRTQHRINAIKSKQAARHQLLEKATASVVTSLLSFTNNSTIRISLDNPNPIGTHQDEEAIIHACRQIAFELERDINSIILDGNAWSNVPVAAGVIDWCRIIDCFVDCFPNITTLTLSNLPHEKVITMQNDQHRIQEYEGEKCREPTNMYFESRLVAPLLQLLRESVLEHCSTFILRWSPSVVASACFSQGRASLPSVLKFNYTLRTLAIVACDGGNQLAELVASALMRANNTLQTLDLTGNNITNVDSISAMLSLGLSGLRSLRMDRNAIGNHGAFVLARSLPTSAVHFKMLSLDGCDIGDDGGMALAKFIRLSSGKKNRWRPKAPPGGLAELYLARNSQIGEKTRGVLRELLSMKETAFKTLDLFVDEIETGGENDGREDREDGEDGEDEDEQEGSKSATSTPRTNKTGHGRTLLERDEEDRHVETSSDKGTYFGTWSEDEGQRLQNQNQNRSKFPLYSLSKLNY